MSLASRIHDATVCHHCGSPLPDHLPITIGTALELFGSQAKLARALGVNQSTVSRWVERGAIPGHMQGRVYYELQRRGIAVPHPGEVAGP